MSRKLPYTKSEAKAWSKETIVNWYDCPITPFNADDSLDEKGLRENIEYYIDIGETGLVLGGFVAECWNTTVTEWMRYHKVIAETAAGRIPLHTIIFDPSVHQAMEKLNYVQSIGFEAAEVVTPIVQLRADDEIFDYYKYLADNSDLAIIFYRSAVSGHLMSLDLCRRLSEIPSIVGMKQGSLNHADSVKLRHICRDDFLVSDPIETHWFNDLRHGGQVMYGAFHHIVYGKKRHLLEEYTELARKGDWDGAFKKYTELGPIRELLDDVMLGPLSSNFTYATTLGNMKAWYDIMGLAAGPLRSPMRQVSHEKREWLADRLKVLGVV